jgi:hypothetical protein
MSSPRKPMSFSSSPSFRFFPPSPPPISVLPSPCHVPCFIHTNINGENCTPCSNALCSAVNSEKCIK